MVIDFTFYCLYLFYLLCLDRDCSHYRCHTCFHSKLTARIWGSIISLPARNYLECDALSCQQAGYVRVTVCVIQHAYSALLYIQETTSCSGCCIVHFMGKRKWEKRLSVEDVMYAHHFIWKWVLKR